MPQVIDLNIFRAKQMQKRAALMYENAHVTGEFWHKTGEIAHKWQYEFEINQARFLSQNARILMGIEPQRFMAGLL